MVLVADDNEISQEIAREVLESAGAAVLVANNGQAALDMLTQHTVDAVIMDVQMPVLDGLETTARIRAQAQHAHLPILAMTASAMVEDRDRCLKAGMNAHVSKPINVDELVRTLRQLLPDSKAAALEPASKPLDELRGLGQRLDLAGALKRLNNNAVLYRSLLDKFSDGFDRWGTEIREAIARGDPTTAQRLAHSLKGTAGNLGDAVLAQAALALETILKKSPTNAAVAVKSVEKHLGELLHLIRAYKTPSLTLPAATQAMDPVNLAAYADWVDALLGNSDARAVDAVQRLLEMGPPTHPRLAELHQCAGRYDFDGARDVLHELRTAWNTRGASH